jgi:exonuclease SbcD
VLVAHLFTSGGHSSESERVFLGNAELVDISLFSGFDYIALGHLHKYQQVGANAYYSGSPLAYSFSEAKHEKCFLSVTLEKGGVSVQPVPITPLRKVSRFEGSFDTFFADKLSDDLKAAADDYLEITLTNKNLVENPMSLLRHHFPHLLNIRQDEAINVRLRENDERLRIVSGGAGRNIVDDFTDFLMDIHGEANAEEIALFKEFLSAERVES